MKWYLSLMVCIILSACGLTACGDDDGDETLPANVEDNGNKESDDSLFSFTGQTIFDKISSQQELSDFAYILERAGYHKTLSSYGTFTVFAPKNSGIRSYIEELYSDEYASTPNNGLSSNSLEDLPDSACERIAKQHIIAVSAIPASKLEELFGHDGSFLNVNGEQVSFSKTEDGKWLLNNRAVIIQTDVEGENGFLNVTDKTVIGVKTDGYAELKQKERQAITDFISYQAITVISETEFENNGRRTDVSRNEFVYLDRTGIYLQIVHEGCGTTLDDGDAKNVMVRFSEQNLLDTTKVFTNFSAPYAVDRMSVSRNGNTYTASFTEGMMLASYGSAVPAGWLIFLPYIKIGRPASPEEQIARVHLIVPHTMGHSFSAQHVTPYYYEITMQE